ncbi:MAG: hypothetical protein HOY79_34090 [Streptomyces sp.]|nr:hypothetical protein [Streptomyces sp.]NUS11411.1 hypothetical protein [Streptomyces sp.]NUS23448.1 hypothetical protein [Streptomyces sp.]
MLLASLGGNALDNLPAFAEGLGAVITVAAIVRGIRPMLRRRVHRWDRLDQLLGDPDANPARPGVLEHVAALRDELADVRGQQEAVRALAAELVPNSGSSFRDAYNRDREHQHAVNEAIASSLGVQLPALPPRIIRHHHDDEA